MMHWQRLSTAKYAEIMIVFILYHLSIVVVYLIIHTKTGQVSYAQVTHLQKRLDELEVKYGMDFKHHDYDEIGVILKICIQNSLYQ